MITITYGCTFLGDQCTAETHYRLEVTLAPETMVLVAMRAAVEMGWSFTGSDPARALCPEHSPTATEGELVQVRVFSRLQQVPTVHGLVMIGLEELAGRHYIALGASRAPEPAGLVRLRRKDLQHVLGAIQEMTPATLERGA
jgi:hypothetical protein